MIQKSACNVVNVAMICHCSYSHLVLLATYLCSSFSHLLNFFTWMNLHEAMAKRTIPYAYFQVQYTCLNHIHDANKSISFGKYLQCYYHRKRTNKPAEKKKRTENREIPVRPRNEEMCFAHNGREFLFIYHAIISLFFHVCALCIDTSIFTVAFPVLHNIFSLS